LLLDSPLRRINIIKRRKLHIVIDAGTLIAPLTSRAQQLMSTKYSKAPGPVIGPWSSLCDLKCSQWQDCKSAGPDDPASVAFVPMRAW
jgi:hypothetical protein